MCTRRTTGTIMCRPATSTTARQLVRVYQFVLPFQQMRPNITRTGLTTNYFVPRYDGHIWVPIDDEHTYVYNWMCSYDQDAALDPDYVEQLEAGYGRGHDDFIPGRSA